MNDTLQPSGPPQPRKRIVFFCCWTYSIRYLRDVLDAIDVSPLPHEVIYLHFDSINYPGKQYVSPYKKIKVIDFYRTYKSLDVYSYFARERPDRVVVINKGSILLRAALIACNALGIDTLQIQEGAVPNITKATMRSRSNRSRSVGGKIPFWRLPRRLRKIVLLYVAYSAVYWHVSRFFPFNRAYLKYSFCLFRDLKYHGTFERDETKARRALCYGQTDLEYFVEIEGYARHEVEAIGKPECVAVISKKQQWDRDTNAAGELKRELYAHCNIDDERDYAVLLSQDFYEAMWMSLSSKLRHLEELRDCVNRAGLLLVTKLHPNENRSILLEHFGNDPGIVFVQDHDLDKTIYAADVVLGYCSTSLLNAVLLEKHPLIIRWLFPEQDFFDPSHWHVATAIESPEDLGQAMEQNRTGALRTEPAPAQAFYDAFVNVDMTRPPVPRIVEAVLE